MEVECEEQFRGTRIWPVMSVMPVTRLARKGTSRKLPGSGQLSSGGGGDVGREMKPPKSPKVTCSASRENGQSLRPALYQTRPYASVKRVDSTTELIGLQLWLQRGAAYDIFYSQTLDPTKQARHCTAPNASIRRARCHHLLLVLHHRTPSTAARSPCLQSIFLIG